MGSTHPHLNQSIEDAITLGVDFGGTSIKIGVVQGSNILHTAPSLPTQRYTCPQEIIEAIIATARDLMQQYPTVCAIGMGMPGWCDFYKGVLYQLTNVPVWKHEVPVIPIVREALGIPAVLDNDANCMAYAEWKLGAGRGMENLVCMTLGTGIGGGLIVNNAPLRTKRLSTGELGMTSIAWDGPPGPFGNKGCIEAYLKNSIFIADAQQEYAKQGQPKTIEECSHYALEVAALGGCPIALALWDRYAAMLSTLIMNMMYTLAPDAFIIGGGIAKAGDVLFTPLRKHLEEQLFTQHREQLKIIPAHFGPEAGIIGAALLAKDNM